MNLSSEWVIFGFHAFPSENSTLAPADDVRSTHPDLHFATEQAGEVHQLCQMLRGEGGCPVETVLEIGDAIARILRDENRHHLLVTGCPKGSPLPAVPATELVASVREIGYRGSIHLRSGFIAPEDLGLYQMSAVDCVLSRGGAGPDTFLSDVQALSEAAPADEGCLSSLQLGTGERTVWV